MGLSDNGFLLGNMQVIQHGSSFEFQVLNFAKMFYNYKSAAISPTMFYFRHLISLVSLGMFVYVPFRFRPSGQCR